MKKTKTVALQACPVSLNGGEESTVRFRVGVAGRGGERFIGARSSFVLASENASPLLKAPCEQFEPVLPPEQLAVVDIGRRAEHLLTDGVPGIGVALGIHPRFL